MAFSLPLGAPGVYELPEQPLRALTGVRMDVCAFAGVAPRGPAQVPAFADAGATAPCDPLRLRRRSVPVPIESWSEYQRAFGGFEGPGRLPYAVASFFENGGRRAYVVRIVHDYGAADPRPTAGVARGALAGITLVDGRPVALRARDEGRWGDRLAAALSLSTRPFAFDPAEAGLTSLALPAKAEAPAGTLLRLTLDDGTRALRFIAGIADEWRPHDGARITRATFDRPVSSRPASADVVEGRLAARDGDGRVELFELLGLDPAHPRWLARVLVAESALLYPDERVGAAWLDVALAAPLGLGTFITTTFAGGEDRYEDLVPDDFFGDWILGDECPGDGVTCLADVTDVSLLCAPDLYAPGPLVAVESIVEPASVAGPAFAPCVPLPPPSPQATTPPDLDGLRLDPLADFGAIVDLQRRLVTFADQLRALIVLLDVPPGLPQRQILTWRSRFSSPFAAAYHPWLDVARADDRRDTLVRVNPSAVAAGLIAQRENSFGVPHGPANLLASGVVDLADHVSPARHATLHPAGVNVYLAERDGVRLTAARTLSAEPRYRQLSVRRLVTMLERVLDRQMQWMVFEPNGPTLWGDVTHVLTAYLRQLFRANAFAGASEGEAFFVRCDGALNTRRTIDAGQLLAEVGVAPAEPLEFIVLQIAREADGSLQVTG